MSCDGPGLKYEKVVLKHLQDHIYKNIYCLVNNQRFLRQSDL
jgi:hypothetical protein